MSGFREYLNDNVLFEEFIQTVEESEYVEVYNYLSESEAVLNEFLGLGKVAEKLGKFSKKADEKVEKAKESAKETIETGKQVAKGVAKDLVGRPVQNVKEIGKSHAEIAQAIGKKFTELSGNARQEFKKLFGALNPKELTPDQAKVYGNISEIFAKVSDGKLISGSDAVLLLATILAKREPGHLPSFSNFTKELEKIRSVPGFATYKFMIKKSV